MKHCVNIPGQLRLMGHLNQLAPGEVSGRRIANYGLTFLVHVALNLNFK